MRKRIGNDKVIRAMAIGIAAVLATASPMTVFAAEGDEPEPDNGNNPGEESSSTGVCDAAQSAADSASDSVDTAAESATTVKADVVANVNAVEAGSVETSEGTKDLAQAVIDAAGKVENNTAEGGAPLAGAETAIENTETQLDAAEAADESSDVALSEAEKATEDAATVATDMKDAMEEASEKADVQADAIKNATTIEEANAAYEELEKTANDAEAQFNEKLEAYNKAATAYENAKADVEKYEKEYEDAIAKAETNAAEAAAKLAKAQENAAALETAVSVAKEAVDKSAATAMAIAEAEKTAQEDGTLNWKNEDKLFNTIMENYYVPKILKGVKDIKVTREQGEDNNEYNYFKVEYIDEDGKAQVKYYNYKMDNGSKDDIVIFEKREVEVNYKEASIKNPDYYQDSNGKTVDVDAGLNDGSIVDMTSENGNPSYYVKKDSTASDTLVSNSEKNETSTTDVTIDEDTKQESWKLDENGNLVKEVTADVTTVTYTDATFTSDQSYATDAKRDEAAEAKKAELEKATGKDATVEETEKTTYTYTASGTYIPTFTKTVEVNKEYESGSFWGEVDSDKEAKEKAYGWAKNKIDDDLGDYYLIGNIESKLSATMTEEETKTFNTLFGPVTVVTDDADYHVTGKVTATYAKVTKQTVDQSTFGSIWNDIKALFGSGKPTNKQLEATAKAAIEADGGIFLSANWDDWSFNKATIRYVAGVKVTTDEKQTEDAASGAVQSAALAQAKANGATGVYNVKTTDTEAIEHTTYSYTVDYLEKASEKKENKTIATETYGNADKLTGVIVQNKNYKDNNILLTQDNEDYRKFVDSAKALTEKYDRLLAEATKANDDVQAAQNNVKSLEDEIDKLKERKSNVALLDDLQTKLDLAKADRDAAEEILNGILDQLTESGEDLTEVTNRLTPSGGGAGGAGGTGGTGGTAVAAATQTGDVLGATRGYGASVEEGDVLGATRAPKTSDSAKGILWMLGMAGSALGATSILAKRKKEEQE